MLLWIVIAWAGSMPCTGKLFNPVTDIDGSCLFPLTVGKNKVVSSHLPDTPNPDKAFCTCPGNPTPKIGVPFSYWEPIGLVDITRSPYCMVNLGDIKIGNSSKQGTISLNTATNTSSFFHVHWVQYPVMKALGLFPSSCREEGNMKILYMSELDPTWNDSALALQLFPETASLSSVEAQKACAADALAANTGLPNDQLFWCAGSQGTLLPLTGHVGAHIGGVQASVLLLERLILKLHRMGLLEDSSPDHLCNTKQYPMLPKSRYRYQMVYPKKTECQPFSRSTMTWGAGLESPSSMENYGYVVWRKRNCCI